MMTDADPQSDVSKQRPPSAARLAEIEAGIVKPTPFEQAYLESRAGDDTDMEEASNDTNPWSKKYVRDEIEVEPAQRGPWYNPHPGTMANVKRAIKPAIYVNSGFLLLTTASAFATGALLSNGLILVITMVILVASILLMLWAGRGSLIAHYLIIGANATSVSRVINLARDGEYAIAATSGTLLAVLFTFWLISATAVAKYDRFRKGKLDL